MACDIPTPSRGEVPRPTSSTKTRECDVAMPVYRGTLNKKEEVGEIKLNYIPRIIAEDTISFAKVLKLFSISSSLERRVRSASCTLKSNI
jgi:hypothetical protein